jgi:hypothetical protein
MSFGSVFSRNGLKNAVCKSNAYADIRFHCFQLGRILGVLGTSNQFEMILKRKTRNSLSVFYKTWDSNSIRELYTNDLHIVDPKI